jgi:uncharacterized membrane protein YidH (DUF202 family)
MYLILIVVNQLTRVAQRWRHAVQQRGGPDRGSTPAELVIIIALMVVLAVAVVAVISAKVLAKARSIDLDG